MSPYVPASVVFIISGRNELDRDCWNTYRELVVSLDLEPFPCQEAVRDLSLKGIVDLRIVDVIFRLSGGLPLLVTTLPQNTLDPA